MESPELVYLQCTNQGSRLRVRIISPGYFNDANCQFPRALRQPNRYFSVPISSVRLAATTGGTYFYRVRDPITILTQPPTTEQLSRTEIVEQSLKRQKGNDSQPVKVYENPEEPNCVVCLDELKEIILVPCGHYCLCKTCFSQLDPGSRSKRCPMCRQLVDRDITPSMLR